MNPLHALNLELLAQGYQTNLQTTKNNPHWNGDTTQIVIANPPSPSDFMILTTLDDEPHLISLRHRTHDLTNPNSIDTILRTIHQWQPPSSPPSPSTSKTPSPEPTPPN